MMMKTVLALAVAALLVGCGGGDTTPVTAGGQCMKDTDCKGDRICDGGACVAPAASVVPGARPSVALQDGAPDAPGADAPAAAPADAPAGPAAQWTSGFGQGNFEHSIEKDGVSVYIGCPTQDGSPDQPASIQLMRSDNTGAAIEPFQVLVKGKSIDGPIDAMSRVGVANFEYVYSAMREGDFTVVYNGQSVHFPVSNGEAELAEVGSIEFVCNLL